MPIAGRKASADAARDDPGCHPGGRPDSEGKTRDPVCFTRPGFVWGATQTLPLAAGVLAVGLVFGVLARQAGLSLLEAELMSGLVFAGAAQFVALGLWGPSLPVCWRLAWALECSPGRPV